MTFADTWVERKMAAAKKFYRRPVTLQITAGWGCTILEIFERDVKRPHVPLVREMLRGEKTWQNKKV